MEAFPTAVPTEIARSAIRDAWLQVVADVERGRANLSGQYLAEVHQRLVTVAGLTDRSGFSDHGLPYSVDGSRTSWDQFVEDCRLNEVDGTEEYALAQFRWGKHVQTFPLTLGWFAMNIVRLRADALAVYPPRQDHGRFLSFLKDAGPDDYDAETGLRGLASEYAEMQSPRGGGAGIA